MRVAEDKMREDCAFSPKSFRRSAVMMMVESDDVSCVGLSDAVDIDVRIDDVRNEFIGNADSRVDAAASTRRSA